MIKLTRIIEQYGTEDQYYDLGKDFSNFKRFLDGSDEQIKKKFEQSIGSQLVNKRIRARASRGYKQYVKDYEFDVTKITIDDYYDNFVIVAHDNSTPKAKEYFLKPGFKIQILGPATGQPSPQKGGNPEFLNKKENPEIQPQTNNTNNNSQLQTMELAPSGKTPTEESANKDEPNGYYDAYGIDTISQDIKKWLPPLLLKPKTALRDFIKGLGWTKDLGRGTSVAMFDLKIPADMVRPNVKVSDIKNAITNGRGNALDSRAKFDVIKIEPDMEKRDWLIRIKKTTTA